MTCPISSDIVVFRHSHLSCALFYISFPHSLLFHTLKLVKTIKCTFQMFFFRFLLDSDRSKSKKKKKRASEKSRQRSMSPLSRRMAMFNDGNMQEAGMSGNNAAYNYPQMFSAPSSSDAPIPNDYDLRVSKFLEPTRDDDNYEEKVRKFIEEASKYKKERKNQESSKKKDRKKSKKNKKDSKKKKKEKKSKSSRKDKDDVIDGNELREAIKYDLQFILTKFQLNIFIEIGFKFQIDHQIAHI